jgi:glycosyltransferase involved in cell wall biosynthesis
MVPQVEGRLMACRNSCCRRIRLVYVITDLGFGGVPLHLYRLACRLPRSLFDVRVIALSEPGPVGQMLRDEGIEVHYCNARSAFDGRALVQLWRLLTRIKPHVVHSLLFHANIAARLCSPFAGISRRHLICEIQTVEWERRWHLIVDNFTCRLCRYEVGNAPSVVEHLHRQGHIPASRLQCVFGAVDADSLQLAERADRKQLGIAPDETMILWTGRFDPVKGFEEMLEGFSMLGQDRPAKLVLVGDGPYRAEVEASIRRLGLSKQVILAGYRKDVPALLKSADIFLLPSRTEGLSNSLLEAMAVGCPVVATDIPGTKDIVSHMRTGLLVPVRSPETIAHALRTVMEDRQLAQRLANHAAEWVAERLDPRRWAAEWQIRYQEAVGD